MVFCGIYIFSSLEIICCHCCLFDKLVLEDENSKLQISIFYWNCLLNSVAKSLIEKVLLVDKGDIFADLHIEIYLFVGSYSKKERLEANNKFFS